MKRPDRLPRMKTDYVGDVDEIVDQQAIIRENMSNLPQEKQAEKLITFERWHPILERFGDPDDMSVEQLLATATPLSIVKLIDLMMTAKSETVQAQCAKDVAYMGGMKPVEKSANVNVNVMTRREASSLLASKLEKFGILVDDGENYGDQQSENDQNEIEGEIIEDGECDTTDRREEMASGESGEGCDVEDAGVQESCEGHDEGDEDAGVES